MVTTLHCHDYDFIYFISELGGSVLNDVFVHYGTHGFDFRYNQRSTKNVVKVDHFSSCGLGFLGSAAKVMLY